MLPIHDLKIMQDGFRLPAEELRVMVDYVAKGGVFSQDVLLKHSPNRHPNLIAVSVFEDGDMYVRDGFHRLLSIYTGRSLPVLYDEEFFFEHMTYQGFLKPNISVGYVTPFDPRIEVRLPNFGEFRRKVMQMVDAGEDPIPFIWDSRATYARPRLSIHSVTHFAEQLKKLLSQTCAA